MEQAITLDDVTRAWQARDPALAELMSTLATQAEPKREVRQDALTWQAVRQKHHSGAFLALAPEVRAQQRKADWQALEAPDAEVPLPDRLRMHEILMDLWHDGSPWARDQLVRAMATLPLQWGPWRAMKRIFKLAEAAGDWVVYGAIAARLDQEYTQWRLRGDVRRATLRYLVRRAWRTLRNLGVRLPAAYPDAASEVLRHYGPRAAIQRSWVANHIFFHELPNAYNRSRFVRRAFKQGRPDLAHRAFAEAWRRSPRPLFSLLEVAQNDAVRSFAIDSLRTDFRTQLREVEAGWVVRLIRVRSATVDQFVAWLLDNVPRFEPASFRPLGLHQAVLELLDSESEAAADWAARYARTYARDLPLAWVVRLANGAFESVRTLARDLLQDRDPRTEVGLDAWGRLLGTKHGHALATQAIQEHFGARELTLAWFHERFVSGDRQVVRFATELLPKVHPQDQIPVQFWGGVLDDERVDMLAQGVVDRALSTADVSGLGTDVLRRALLHPDTSSSVMRWVDDGHLEARMLGVDFVKSVAYPPSWDASEWIGALRQSDRAWAHELEFDDFLADWALLKLGDPRAFTAHEIGVGWLLDMVRRSEGRYHRFAVDTMTRSFAPADFGEGNPEAGAERLWAMATGTGAADEPERRFALHYLELHHPQIHLEREEQPLTPGAEVPPSLLTFARTESLLRDERTEVRALGIAWAKQEMVAFDPSLEALMGLSELPHDDVHELVVLVLTADDKQEHQRYRLDPAKLTADGVYRFCDSLDARTRGLGLRLIQEHPRLAVPEELFRLTESPDRHVRAFVVRQLWSMYRRRAASEGYEAPVRKDGGEAGPVAHPEGWPAEEQDIRAFLRRTLFGIPPGRQAVGGGTEGVRRLAARQAKLALIEVCRDLALEDEAFATRVTPLFQEFLGSRGASESAACLVALTQLRHRWGGEVGGLPGGVR